MLRRLLAVVLLIHIRAVGHQKFSQDEVSRMGRVYSGEEPVSVLACFTSAPLATKNLATSRCPFLEAVHSGKATLSVSPWFTSAPSARKSTTTSRWFFSAAV